MKKCFIDIETNKSLDPITGKITQLAGIIEINGFIKKKFNFKKNIYKNLLQLLDKYVDKYDPEDKLYFIGYNVSFDEAFIRQLFINNKNKFYGSYFYNPSVDVLQMVANKAMNKKMRPKSFKLVDVARFYKIPVVASKFHDAEYDILITRKLYKKVK